MGGRKLVADCTPEELEQQREYGRLQYRKHVEKRKAYAIANAVAWRSKNYDRHLANVKKWKRDNPEKVKASIARTSEKNRARAKKWAKEHPGVVEARSKKWMQDNREQYRETSRKWARAHPATRKAVAHRRRARVLALDVHFTKADVLACLTLQGSRCFYCLASLVDGYHVDHMTPIARGGSNGPENIVCACGPCNLKKSDRTFAEFVFDLPGPRRKKAA